MKHGYPLALSVRIGATVAVAQAGAGAGSQTMPSTPPSQSGAQQTPDQSPAGQTGAAASTKAQSDIQSALRKQLPASADSVTVSTTDDGKIQLSGSVSSDTEKQQVEQIARSAAPNVEIVNKLNVSSSPSGPGAVPPAGSQPPASSKPPMLRLVAYQQQPTTPGQTSPSGQQPDTQTAPSGANTPNSTSDQAGSVDKDKAQAGNSGDVQDKIQKAIQQDPSLANANINVMVSGNKVELNGTVASKDQKKTAKQIAETNGGGMKVMDHLKVSGHEGNNSPNETSPSGNNPPSTNKPPNN
jgi:osmotically-inducible protein OsmY